jgi:hypothetical protein
VGLRREEHHIGEFTTETFDALCKAARHDDGMSDTFDTGCKKQSSMVTGANEQDR